MAVDGLKDRAARGQHPPGSPTTVVVGPPAGPMKLSPFATQQASLDINGNAGALAAPIDRFSVAVLPKQAAGGDNNKLALLSVATLTLQCTATSIVLRYSRTQAGTPYLPSVAGALRGFHLLWSPITGPLPYPAAAPGLPPQFTYHWACASTPTLPGFRFERAG